MEIKKTNRNVICVTLDDVSAGWEKWFFLSSDRHHDSVHCNRTLAKRHLEKVVERDAHVLDFGDFFDAMQGKYDPRKNYAEMKPEYLGKMLAEGRGYLDVIVDDAVKFYGPYAKRILVIGRGNHETAIYKHNDVDLIGNLVRELNKPENGGGSVSVGGYGGWVRFLFGMPAGRRKSFNLKYFHGSGGAAVVTKGTIQANRQSVFLPDADIIVNGHIHESWIVTYKRERLSNMGVPYQDYVYHVRTPGYKDGYGDGYGGFDVEHGGPPKPAGGVWLRFYYHAKKINFELTQDLG